MLAVHSGTKAAGDTVKRDIYAELVAGFAALIDERGVIALRSHDIPAARPAEQPCVSDAAFDSETQ